MSLIELKQKKADLVKEAQSLANPESGILSTDDRVKANQLVDQIKGITEQIKQIESDQSLQSQIDSFAKDLDQPAQSVTSPFNISSQPYTPKVEVKERDYTKEPNHGYVSQQEYLQEVMDVYTGKTQGEIPARLKGLQAAGSDEHTTVSDPYGGFLVPEGFSPSPMSLGSEVDFIAGRTTNIPMGSPRVKLNARVDKNHTSSVSGGLTVTRRSETSAMSSSRQEYEQVVLNATGLTGLAYISEELLADSAISVPALLEQGFRDEFVSTLIDERLNGTGAGEMEGIANAGCTIEVAKEGAQAADTIVGANIVKMRQRVWRYNQAIWIANIDCYEQLCQAHIAGSNSDVFLFNPSRGIDIPDTLLGRPIFFTEYANTLGDAGDIYCANWSQYLEGTYQPLQSAESIHVRFINHERTFKFYMRNDGRCWWRTALTPKNSSETLSPFVKLAERA